MALPVALQAIAIYHTEAAIEELQPTIAQVDALRRGAAAGDAGRDVLVKEAERTGDVLQTLAMVTRIYAQRHVSDGLFRARTADDADRAVRFGAPFDHRAVR